MISHVCKICSGMLQLLPVPQVDSAILSDGRVLGTQLEKASCISCGVATHINPIPDLQVKASYGEEYSLSAASPLADKDRAQAYAKILVGRLSPCDNVMEIGCGSGNLLRVMGERWEESHFYGIDPALPTDIVSSGKVQYARTFFDTGIKDLINKQFDLIYSINVIEHVSSATEFFDLAADLLLPDGHLVIICPASEPPNLELLFYDHLYTYTPISLATIAEKSGFSFVESVERLLTVGDFQLIIFRKSEDIERRTDIPHKSAAAALTSRRATYLNAWKSLDGALIARTSHAEHLAIFGAGQMAALIRAYAPQVWDKVELLVMDSIEDAWKFDKPIGSYEEQLGRLKQGYAVIVATAPAAQQKLTERFVNDGVLSIRFDDIISH